MVKAAGGLVKSRQNPVVGQFDHTIRIPVSEIRRLLFVPWIGVGCRLLLPVL
jgi:hypothetical protein